MLNVKNLKVSYGAVQAVRGVELALAQAEVVALIGANGAGKTSIAKAIAGILPFSGTVELDGVPLASGHAEKAVSSGLSLVPEGRGILTTMTVEENLKLGAYSRRDRLSASREIEDIYARFPILGARKGGAAGLLSGGEQQVLAIARALLAKPRVLLLDEPSLGLSPKMAHMIFDLVVDLRKSGMSVLLIEQKARHALKIADRAYLIDLGKVVTSGPAKELAKDPVVSSTFLGGSPSVE